MSLWLLTRAQQWLVPVVLQGPAGKVSPSQPFPELCLSFSPWQSRGLARERGGWFFSGFGVTGVSVVVVEAVKEGNSFHA